MLRKLGKTEIEVSEVGFGAWQLGNTREDGSIGQDAVDLVQKAIESGCNFFDTAPNYAGGNSEKLLGKALKNKREDVVINSKFGHSPDDVIDFDSTLIRDSVAGSLKRLETDYLDSVLLHNPSFEILEGKTDHFDILAELKAEGKIKAYGASVDTSKEIFALLNNTDAEVIEIMFNIFHQEPR
ncbi:MAG: aldo/keto reductase, partial [Halarsenatibacteraceae bacterium]